MMSAVEHAAVRRSGRTRAGAPPALANGVRSCMFVSMCVCAHVCMSSAQPPPPLEASAGPQALLSYPPEAVAITCNG